MLIQGTENANEIADGARPPAQIRLQEYKQPASRPAAAGAAAAASVSVCARRGRRAGARRRGRGQRARGAGGAGAPPPAGAAADRPPLRPLPPIREFQREFQRECAQKIVTQLEASPPRARSPPAHPNLHPTAARRRRHHPRRQGSLRTRRPPTSRLQEGQNKKRAVQKRPTEAPRRLEKKGRREGEKKDARPQEESKADQEGEQEGEKAEKKERQERKPSGEKEGEEGGEGGRRRPPEGVRQRSGPRRDGSGQGGSRLALPPGEPIALLPGDGCRAKGVPGRCALKWEL
ncbi:Protein of unknown function, partial [Gryllus bimaculatus]